MDLTERPFSAFNILITTQPLIEFQSFKCNTTPKQPTASLAPVWWLFLIVSKYKRWHQLLQKRTYRVLHRQAIPLHSDWISIRFLLVLSKINLQLHTATPKGKHWVNKCLATEFQSHCVFLNWYLKRTYNFTCCFTRHAHFIKKFRCIVLRYMYTLQCFIIRKGHAPEVHNYLEQSTLHLHIEHVERRSIHAQI